MEAEDTYSRKPNWIRRLKCCGEITMNFGAFDFDMTPRQIHCLGCGKKTDFHLTVDMLVYDWARLTGQDPDKLKADVDKEGKGKFRKCSLCGREFPLTEEHFYLRKSKKFYWDCIECTKKEVIRKQKEKKCED